MSCTSCGGVGTIGTCPGHLDLCLHRGTVFDGVLTHFDPVTGLPTNWPAATIAKLHITWGTGTLLEYVVGPVVLTALPIDLTMAQTTAIPRGAHIELWVDYSGTGTQWFAYLTGFTVEDC